MQTKIPVQRYTHTHMSLQRLTTTRPHTNPHTHMKPHPTHTLQTHIHEGPTKGAPHTNIHTHAFARDTHHCCGITATQHTYIKHTPHTHTNYNTHSRAVKHGDARVYVTTNTCTQCGNNYISTQMQEHRHTSTPTHTHTAHTHTNHPDTHTHTQKTNKNTTQTHTNKCTT